MNVYPRTRQVRRQLFSEANAAFFPKCGLEAQAQQHLNLTRAADDHLAREAKDSARIKVPRAMSSGDAYSSGRWL